jgi:hypothetical protein
MNNYCHLASDKACDLVICLEQMNCLPTKPISYILNETQVNTGFLLYNKVIMPCDMK